jgi:Fe-S cluster biogenesis protein NfuA
VRVVGWFGDALSVGDDDGDCNWVMNDDVIVNGNGSCDGCWS